MLEWNHDDFQFTVYKAISSIRSAPRALQIAPTNQPHTVAKLLQIVTPHQKLNRLWSTWFHKKRGNSRLSATISFLRRVLYGVRKFLRKCGMRMLAALN